MSSPFFSTYGVSLVTVFRMFVDDTLGIMYEASDTTTETARLYFISFAVLFSLLFAQLLLGIVVNMFTMVKQLNSSQAYSCLNQFFANTNTDVSLRICTAENWCKACACSIYISVFGKEPVI